MVNWKKALPMFLVCTTVVLMWGIWTIDVTLTGIISVTGVPSQFIGQGLLLEEVSPRIMYHGGLLGIMLSYILVVSLAVEGWTRNNGDKDEYKV